MKNIAGLKENESWAMLKALLDSFPGNVAILDDKGKIVLVNQAWINFGIENWERKDYKWVGTNYLTDCLTSKLIFSERVKEVSEGISTILSGETASFELEYPCYISSKERLFLMRGQGIDIDGRHWVFVSHKEIMDTIKTPSDLVYTKQALFDKDEKLYAYQSCGQYFKQHKQIDKPLYYPGDFSDKLIQTANTIVVGLDTYGNVNFINPRGEEITGYSQFEILGKNWFKLIVPINKFTEVRMEFKRLLEGGLPKTFQNYIKTKSGEELFISWSNNEILNEEKIVGIISFGIDITEQKQAEEKLRISEEKFRNIFHKSPASITITNLKTGEFIDVNETFERDFGYSREEIIGKSSLDIGIWKNIADRDRLMVKYLENGYIGEEGLEFIKKSGQTLIADVSFSMIDIGGKKYSIVIVLDITKLNNMKYMVREYQQKLKSLVSQLTIAEERERRRIAAELHDNVGQSLALARIQLATLRKSISRVKDINTLDYISKTLLDSIQNIRGLITDLSSPSMNEMGISAAISEWMEEQIEMRHNLQTEFIDYGQKRILTDDVRAILFRNVRELLTNVVKHARAKKVSVCLEDTVDSLKIIVRDDGIGFAPENTFGAMKNKSGFGLFSIQERMTSLGGSLEIISEPGEGSTIIITTPINIEKNKEMMQK